MTIEQIRAHCASGSLRWTYHLMMRLLQRGIQTTDMQSVLETGQIIEQYPSDYPYPSCLVLGLNSASIPIHVVCGASPDELWLITAYIPDENEWMPGYQKRREKPE